MVDGKIKDFLKSKLFLNDWNSTIIDNIKCYPYYFIIVINDDTNSLFNEYTDNYYKSTKHDCIIRSVYTHSKYIIKEFWDKHYLKLEVNLIETICSYLEYYSIKEFNTIYFHYKNSNNEYCIEFKDQLIAPYVITKL